MDALLIIDVQKGFQDPSYGKRSHPEAETNILKLLENYRQLNKPVIHIQHIALDEQSLFANPKYQAFQQGFEPLANEPVFQKHVNSAFIGTNLEAYLHQHQITDLTIVGLTLPHCVSTTTRMAANLGFHVTLIKDATATFSLPDTDGFELEPDLIHRYNLASLNHEFANIISTEEFFAKLKKN